MCWFVYGFVSPVLLFVDDSILFLTGGLDDEDRINRGRKRFVDMPDEGRKTYNYSQKSD